MSNIQWSNQDGNFVPCGPTILNLPAGAYEPVRHMWSYAAKAINLGEESRFMLEESQSAPIMEEITKFWSRKGMYDHMVLKHQRGILLYGEPGMGKTATAHLIAQHVINEGGIFLNCSDFDATAFVLESLREVEPDRPVVVLIEDIDDQYDSDVVELLDGVAAKKTHVVFLATTNYIDNLSDRIKNRPSRFDLRIEVLPPSEKVRIDYLLRVLNGTVISEKLFGEMVEKSEGLSFAHLKEMVVGVVIYGLSPDEVVERLEVLGDDGDDDKPSIVHDPDEDSEILASQRGSNRASEQPRSGALLP